MKKYNPILIILFGCICWGVALGLSELHPHKAISNVVACPAQPLNYPCDGSGNPTYTNYDYANIWIQQDTINAILRRLIKQPALVATACPAQPLNYPCDGSGNPTYTSYDLANIWIQQDTTIALLRKLSITGGGGGGPVIDSAWLLTGNTESGGQYIGTNNDAPFEIKTDNIMSGYIDPTGNGLTYLGWKSGLNTTTPGNTAIGYLSLSTYGGSNNCTAVGDEALFEASATDCTAIGAAAGQQNYTGSYNTYLGAYADISTNTFTNCTAVGYNAMSFGSNMVTLGNSSIDSVSTYGCLNVNGPLTVVNAITCTMPFQGREFKKVVIYCAANSTSSTYTFPVAFTNTPGIIVATNGPLPSVVTSLNTTSVTITNSPPQAGYIFLEGN